MAVLLATTFAGVEIYQTKQENKKEEKRIIALLAGSEWVRNDNENEEHITFGKDGHFSYWEVSNGNPVGDFELYDSFEIDVRKNTIVALPVDENYEKVEMHVVKMTSDLLELRFEGNVLTFHQEKE